MNLYDNIEKTRHLGESFLLWLCYKSNVNDAYFHLESEQNIELNFDSDMTFEAKFANTEMTKLSGAAPAYSLEAKQALKQNKIISQAKIKIKKDEKEWIFTLKASDLSLSGLKIPALLTAKNDDKLYERQFLIEELQSLIAELYFNFLNIRLDDDKWKNESQDIKNWIEQQE